MKKLLFPLLLCALLLCGCGGQTGQMHVYADHDPNACSIGGQESPRGVYYDLVLTDDSIPQNAILHAYVRNTVWQDFSPTAFWEELGFTVREDPQGYVYGHPANLRLIGPKSLYLAMEQHLAQEVDPDLLRNTVLTLAPVPHLSHGMGEYPGPVYYAAHPQQFVDPPSVYYRMDRQTRTASPAEIRRLLRDDRVEYVCFDGIYKIME